ncbi:ribonuclease T [Sphingomonas sp. Leaf412]|uniref:ribonuclease T2 family protein n=1 Tax=Sphingomonas sp. Leaf412 TaxID=1736370 RepID=UPI0006F710D1|nr:ribonuclease T [Sphingomonas sp. Leaf412]KQT32480.1 ribonuclease T [Sphingomonas sp. Leaf412]
MIRAMTAAVLLLPGAATAQALSCAIPRDVPRPRPDLPDAKQPVRRLPTAGYTLAVSWSPGYCRERGDRPAARFQCGGGNEFGFVLHGLWPDGPGKDWPQYCRATGLLSRQEVRRNLCATPSVQLLQHEWAKHGTCIPGYTPQKYFARSTAMFRRLRFPDMAALSRRPTLTAGTLAAAIAAENAGMRADMMRVTANRQGWLEELWLCHDLRFRPVRCPAHQGGLAPGAPVRISGAA